MSERECEFYLRALYLSRVSEANEWELFENNVKHNEEKEMGLNAKICEEKNNEEDYTESGNRLRLQY